MGRRDRGLGQPFTADGPLLAAILGALDDIHDLLDDRLGKPAPADEPTPDAKPDVAEPAEEPAETRPDPDAGPEPIDITEPVPPRRRATKKTTRKA